MIPGKVPAPRAGRRVARARRSPLAPASVTAAHVLAARGAGVTRLRPVWTRIARALPHLGPVTAITRNGHAVLETRGAFGHLDAEGAIGRIRGPGMELHLTLPHWHATFAVRDPGPHGTRRTLQTFDRHGAAVHEVRLGPRSDVAAFEVLAARFAESRTAPPSFEPPPSRESGARPAERVDATAVRRAWDELPFLELVRRFGVTRQQTLQMVGSDRAREIRPAALVDAFDVLAALEVPLACFIGNRGVVQVHRGPVGAVRGLRGGIDLLALDAELRVRAGAGRIWAVTKPTRDGPVHSVEMFAPGGRVVATVGADRRSADPRQLAWWRDVVGWLPSRA